MPMERCKDNRGRSVSGSYSSFRRDTAKVLFCKKRQAERWLGLALKSVVVGDMLHNVLYPAVQDVAQAVDGVGFDIFIVP